MEIKGKIIQLLPLQTGTGKNGEWKKQDYIIETEGQITRKVCFNLWGDKISQFNLRENESVTVSFDLESREFNGRWYTDVKAWKIDRSSKQQGSPGAMPVSDSLTEEPNDLPAQKEMDDLPF
jgi:hypothetical protein